jgi:hypothetical protein
MFWPRVFLGVVAVLVVFSGGRVRSQRSPRHRNRKRGHRLRAVVADLLYNPDPRSGHYGLLEPLAAGLLTLSHSFTLLEVRERNVSGLFLL